MMIIWYGVDGFAGSSGVMITCYGVGWFYRFIWCRSTSGVMITCCGVGGFAGSSGVGAHLV